MSMWDDLPKLVQSALEMGGGAALGALQAPSGNVDVSGYWGAINRAHTRKALTQLWQTRHPGQPLPPGVESVAEMNALEPKYKLGPGGQLITEKPGERPTVEEGFLKPATKYTVTKGGGVLGETLGKPPAWITPEGTPPTSETDTRGYPQGESGRLAVSLAQKKKGGTMPTPPEAWAEVPAAENQIQGARDRRAASKGEGSKWIYDEARGVFLNKETHEVATPPNLPPKPAPDKETARLDKGFQQATSQITSLRKPISDQAERMGRLVVSVDEHTPQADALIAPELLTAMAGGMGSGLRMNEAEISRIVGGRSKWETLHAALNQWQLDPTKAVSITEAQRAQIRRLVKVMTARIEKKLSLMDQAGFDLIAASSVESQRQIVARLHKQITGATLGQARNADQELLDRHMQ